jgi:hypothetical protein
MDINAAIQVYFRFISGLFQVYFRNNPLNVKGDIFVSQSKANNKNHIASSGV